MAKAGKTVSLVLGSGGARGLAHMGCIQALLERGYQIRCIAGSSMGALVGGIHAAGQLDAYRDWVCALQKVDVVRLLDFSWGGNGLLKGERIIAVLRELVGERDIEDLDIAYTAVATDLATQREVWLQKGPLFDAIRASIAIPSVFTPYELRGRTLVDGGLVNPLPIAPTLSEVNDLIIAVDVSASAEPVLNRRTQAAVAPQRPPHETDTDSLGARVHAFIDSLFDKKLGDAPKGNWTLQALMGRSIDTMQNTIARMKLALFEPDLVVRVPVSFCAFYEFWRGRELAEIGYERTAAALERYEAGSVGDEDD